MAEIALIVGAGSGLSAALARLFAKEGMRVALAARDTQKLEGLCAETGARAFACDASRPDAVAALFQAVERELGPPDLVVYNAGQRVPGSITEVDALAVQQSLLNTAYGGFLVAQQAARRMLEKGRGTLLFTGASASVKGYPRSAAFAMGKFGLRGLAQALARELQPMNIHVGHVVIDGGVRRAGDPRAAARGDDGMLEPDAVARAYLELHRQHRSAWSWEIELRPWRETF
ncbi:MAG: SDR family NAD(P)-dependent oxidoreductase [Alphaproteobacteria bacterium]|nr:SDR family NAD(P)-dependent oxidoreductase [Alphaproteobacteria bacterium]